MLFCTLQKQVIQCNSRPMGLRSYWYVLFCYWVTLFIKEELKRKNMSSSLYYMGSQQIWDTKRPIERKHRYTMWLGRSDMTRYSYNISISVSYFKNLKGSLWIEVQRFGVFLMWLGHSLSGGSVVLAKVALPTCTHARQTQKNNTWPGQKYALKVKVRCPKNSFHHGDRG